MKQIPSEIENSVPSDDKSDGKDIDWEEVDKEAKRCLKICMEMDELDNN